MGKGMEKIGFNCSRIKSKEFCSYVKILERICGEWKGSTDYVEGEFCSKGI
jgi:hypothetical protein